MTRLADLDARFIKYVDERTCRYVDRLEDADGIFFLCPKCFMTNGGPKGTHSIRLWFAGRGVPADDPCGPGRWNPSGTGMEDLTFVGPGSTSVLLQGGCGWHGYVKGGDAT